MLLWNLAIWLDTWQVIALLIFIFIVERSILGIATNIVLKNRGYYNLNWFWWGFFFGYIAMIVALSKRENHEPVMDEEEYRKDVLKNGGWVCSFCNSLNDYSVTSCSCGRNRGESERHMKETEKLNSD